MTKLIKQPELTIELGKKYKDIVSGFTGIAVAKAEYLFENTEILIQTETGNSDPKSLWIAETKLKLQSDDKVGFKL